MTRGSTPAVSLWLFFLRRQARKEYTSSDVAFLYQLDRRLQPRTLLKRLGQRVGGFLVGVP